MNTKHSHELLADCNEAEERTNEKKEVDAKPLPSRKGTNVTFTAPSKASAASAAPDTMLAELYHWATYDSLQPLHYLPYRSIPSWKDKKLVEQLRGSLYLSRELRAAYSVLNDLSVEFPDDCELGSVMVSFSEKASRSLVEKASEPDSKRTIANEYAHLINKRMSDRDIAAAWFCVIGDAKNPRRADFKTNPYSGLHCHCIVAYIKEDKKALKKIFRMDKSSVKNSMSWVTQFQGGPINVGAADYLSKHFIESCRFIKSPRSQLYLPNPIRAAAKLNYKDRRELYKTVEKNHSQFARMSLQSILFLHQHFPDLF